MVGLHQEVGCKGLGQSCSVHRDLEISDTVNNQRLNAWHLTVSYVYDPTGGSLIVGGQ